MILPSTRIAAEASCPSAPDKPRIIMLSNSLTSSIKFRP
jgi:hypothetical protein